MLDQPGIIKRHQGSKRHKGTIRDGFSRWRWPRERCSGSRGIKERLMYMLYALRAENRHYSCWINQSNDFAERDEYTCFSVRSVEKQSHKQLISPPQYRRLINWAAHLRHHLSSPVSLPPTSLFFLFCFFSPCILSAFMQKVFPGNVTSFINLFLSAVFSLICTQVSAAVKNLCVDSERKK